MGEIEQLTKAINQLNHKLDNFHLEAPSPEEKVLTAKELADLLDLNKNTIYELCKKKDGIPHFKVGRKYKFYSEAIRKWLLEQSFKNQADSVGSDIEEMKLERLK